MAKYVAMVALVGCGPDATDVGDVFPRNCGAEGPVDLLRTDSWPGVLDAVSTYYLADVYTDTSEHQARAETYVVGRCGDFERLVETRTSSEDHRRVGVVGDFLLSCDLSTGDVDVLDPAGEDPPRRIFEGVDGCYVVPLGDGLAAQARDASTVWFHPDPHAGAPIVVTDQAKVMDVDEALCTGFTCGPASYRYDAMLRSAGDGLLVWMSDESLWEFSPSTRAMRMHDPGPINMVALLQNQRYFFVSAPLRTSVVDRVTDARFPFPYGGASAWTHELGEWLVYGGGGAPIIPEPPQWTILRARHWATGVEYEFTGRQGMDPQARFSADSLLVRVSPEEGEDYQEVVWPASGRRERVMLPGEDFWWFPDVPGVFACDDAGTVRHLAAVGESPRVILQDAKVLLVTTDRRVVFMQHGTVYPATSPLSVMMPDESIVHLDDDAYEGFGENSPLQRWPVERDEIIYAARNESGHFLRRTVLP